MSRITDPDAVTRWTLTVLVAYVIVALTLAVGRLRDGTGSVAAIGAYGVLLASGLWFRLRLSRVGAVAGWLPFAALPVAYIAAPWSMARGGRYFDAAVQGWESLVFGGQPSQWLAARMPWPWLSEPLHLAYLLYYAIIYGPPLLIWLRSRTQFAEAALSFTIAMVICFALFAVLPVAGPRYVFGESELAPPGFFRDLAHGVLKRGSSKGTAFPSSHVAIAFSIALSCVSWSARGGVVVIIASVLLGVGAVYGGFHYAVDVVAGLVVALTGHWIARLASAKAGPA